MQHGPEGRGLRGPGLQRAPGAPRLLSSWAPLLAAKKAGGDVTLQKVDQEG